MPSKEKILSDNLVLRCLDPRTLTSETGGHPLFSVFVNTAAYHRHSTENLCHVSEECFLKGVWKVKKIK